MVQDYDEPILKHLVDIQLKFHDEPMGFTLEFHFTENEYFTNKVLTKYYEMKCVPDKEDPFGFEGPEIFKCKVSHTVLPFSPNFIILPLIIVSPIWSSGHLISSLQLIKIEFQSNVDPTYSHQ